MKRIKKSSHVLILNSYNFLMTEFALIFVDAPWLFLTLYIVYISFYVIWTDMSENKLFVIVIVIVIKQRLLRQFELTAPLRCENAHMRKTILWYISIEKLNWLLQIW